MSRHDKGKLLGVVAPTFFYSTEAARLKGYRFNAAANSTTIFDVEITTQILIQGGQFWFRNVDGYNDDAHFSVVDKNNTLGLHTLYGLPIGTPIELTRYIDSYPVPPGQGYNDQVILETVAPITAGLFLRAVYNNTGNNEATIGILYRWYEDL